MALQPATFTTDLTLTPNTMTITEWTESEWQQTVTETKGNEEMKTRNQCEYCGTELENGNDFTFGDFLYLCQSCHKKLRTNSTNSEETPNDNEPRD